MSSSIVCNCDTFGIVDYGMPLNYTKPDYRTSTSRGLRHIPPIGQEFYGYKLHSEKGVHVDVKYGIYKTQNNRTYDHKYQKPYGSEKPNFPPRTGNNHYMRNVKELMYKTPPIPKERYSAEYSDQYRLKVRDEPCTNMPDLATRTTCKVSVYGKTEHPRIKPEEPGIYKHGDIYLTTNQSEFVPYSTNQMNASKDHIVTFWETKTSPEIQICNIKKPINDARVFTRVIKDRIVPRLVYRVPFMGKTSEYKGNYVPQTRACLYTRVFKTDVKFEESLSKPNLSQSLAAPNMYCTEYCHIGIGRPVCAAVARKYEKKVLTHPMCGDHY